MILAAILSATLLSGCVTEASSVVDRRVCPVEKRYTSVELAALGKAIQAADPVIQQAAIDYMRLRDHARACRGKH